MSLSASALASLIKTNLSDATDAITANQILGDTISSYLLSNTVFTFVWTATQPGTGTPDPVKSAGGIFKSLIITITPSGATDPTSANEALKDQIIAGMTDATYNISATGFVTSPAVMSSSSTIKNLDLTPSGETDGDTAMLNLCTKIINWVKQLAPTAPCSGSRISTYAGSGVVSTIS